MFVKPQISVCVCFCISSVMFRSWLWSTTGNLVLWCFQHCLFCSELLRLTGSFVLPYECQDCLLSGSVRDCIKSGIASGNVATVLILLTRELGRFFRLLMSTATSSFHVLEFSLYRSFISLLRLSPEYSLRSKLMGLFSRFVLQSFALCIKKSSNFFMLIFHPATLFNGILFNNSLMELESFLNLIYLIWVQKHEILLFLNFF